MERLQGESNFEYKLRLCLGKLNKEVDLDWQEIVELIGEDVSPDHLRKTSYGLFEYDNYIKNINGVAKRILCISDLHVPYNLPISTFQDYAGKVDELVINGDILDCQSLSKFSKKYRISFMEEMIVARQYLIDLIESINPKTVHIVIGNHDNRMGNYLAKNLDSDILELMPNNPLELIVEDGFKHNDKRNKTKTYYEPIKDMFDGIDVIYNGNWYTTIGKTVFCHPLAYSSGMLKTTEKAVQYFNKIHIEFDCICMAHTHQLGSYINGGVYMFEQGTCSRTDELDYMDGRLSNPQQKGFIYICQDVVGNLIYDKTKLIKL